MRRKENVSAIGLMVAVGLWIVSSGFEMGQAHAQQHDTQPAPPSGRMSITVQEGRLTASIQDYPVGPVLEALSSRMDVTLFPAENLDIEENRVSAELHDVPLDEGLRRLLKDYDTFFYYGVVGSEPSFLRAVWIYRKGEASALRPVPPETWASTREMEASLADWDPEIRQRAYEALMSRPGRESRELVLEALRGTTEKDSAMRELLLSAAFAMGMQVPPDLLGDLARWDGSEGIRLMALDALAGHPTVKQIALIALGDRSEAVRQKAKEILTNLDASEYPPDGGGR